MIVPITRPFIGKEEISAVTGVLKSGWLTQGKITEEFENNFRKYVKCKYAVAVNSCTSGLFLALKEIGIGDGDEVIMPAMTYVATANAVETTGAKPVFVDVEKNTFNIDAGLIEKKITKRTKAIMPVHLFGLCCDMDAITGIAEKYGLKIIEDSACGIGSKYGGRHCGTFGDFGVFSFHPRKIMTTGEGGMIATNDKRRAERIRVMRSHGVGTSEKNNSRFLPQCDIPGYNFRISDILSAVGAQQLKKVDDLIARRTYFANIYTIELSDVQEIVTPFVPDRRNHTFQSYIIRVKTEVERLAKEFMRNGIAVREATYSIPSLNYYKKKYGLKEKDYPNATSLHLNTLTLPLYPQMTERQVRYVVGICSTTL